MKLHFGEYKQVYVDGLVPDCDKTVANALELLQSCTKPSMYQVILIKEF